MGHKHLHELLREDQEPFLLKNYVADRRSQLKSNPQTTTALNPRKRKPLIQSTSAPSFCLDHVCLFPFHDSPDVRKSPFPLPAIKSPFCKSPNNASVFLHIPSRTAAMLLDAAVRIQKPKKAKSFSFSNARFGLFASLFKRLKDRRTRKIRRESSILSPPTNRTIQELGVAGSDWLYVTKRNSSADWSEKQSDFKNSCSSSSVSDSEGIEFVGENDGFASTDKLVWSSPSSPFRFSLERSYSPGCLITPDFISPATSPSHHPQKEKLDYETERSQEEEDKDQCSPVSVLDTMFEDDDKEHDVVTINEDGLDFESAYTNVQRTKHKLLQKLHRFEKLVKLDPTELEKHMSEEGGDPFEEETTNINRVFLKEIFKILDVVDIPTHMNNLVSDLVVEESKNGVEHDGLVSRVLCRLESWKMVESNTIDMMVEFDFREESSEGWRRYDEEKIEKTGIDIEGAIFGILMDELAQELVFS